MTTCSRCLRRSRRGEFGQRFAGRLDRKSARTLLLSTLCLVTSCAAFAQTSVLQNGSFENDFTAWTATGNLAIATGDPSHPASAGTKVVVLNPANTIATAVLSQTFPTIAGQRYGLAFDVGRVGGVIDGRLRVTVEGASVILNQILEFSGITASPFYIPQNLTFVATGASTKLTFADLSISPLLVDSFIDNVRVVPQNAQLPLITSQPARRAVAAGRSATFSVTASGTGLSYQWRYNGTNIAGATGRTYAVTSAAVVNAGNYSVVVTNGAGSVASSAATLTVLPADILLNGSFEFSGAAWTINDITRVYSTLNPAYEYSDGVQMMHFNYGQTAAGGTLSQTFATAPGVEYLLSFDAGAFSLLNQNEMRVQVRVQGASTLLLQNISVFAPGNGTVFDPQLFSFVADGPTATLTFIDTSPTTLNVDLVLDNVRVARADALPVITAHPQNATVTVGGSATFGVTATGPGPLFYQWRFNGSPIAGADASTYIVAGAQPGNAGSYDVVVSNAAGQVVSNAATLSVIAAGGLVNGSFEADFTGWTHTGNVLVVAADVIYVPTDGSRAVTFNAGQATPNGVVAQTFATSAGQAYTLAFDAGAMSFLNTNVQRLEVTVQGSGTLLTQVIAVAAPGNGTRYVAQSFPFVANSAATTLRFRDVSTSTINVDLMLDNVRVALQSAPTITSQPQSLTVSAGAPAAFSVTASGQGPLAYQWRFNQVNISGATASSFTIASAQPSHAGSYDVIVSNSFGSVTSTAAALIVQTGVPGTFTNGSFEAGFTGWTTTGAAVVETASPVWVATDGSRAVAFNAGQSTPSGVVAQTFTTSAGQAYTLAFDAGAMSFLNTNVQRLEVTVQGSGTLLTQTITIAAPGNGTRYLPQSFQFVANSATTTLRFRDVSTTTINVDLMLDNVRVIPGAPAGGLTNGSFEADFTGWTATGNVQAVAADAIYVPTDGSRVVVFNPGVGTPTGVVSQTFATTAGQGYALTFDAGAMSFLNTDVQRLEVTVQGSSTLLTQTITIAAPGNGTRYVPQSFAFVANSAATTLTFRDVSTATTNVDLMLDNVRVVPGAAAGELTNGSFEANFTGWTATGNVQAVAGDAIYVPTDGSRVVVFNPGVGTPTGVVSQTFATTAGQGYALTFDAGAMSFLNTNEQRLEVTVQGSGALLTQTITIAAPGNGTRYLPHSLTFVANSAATTLTFRDVSTAWMNVDLMLDNVRVTTGAGLTNGSFENDSTGWTATGHQSIATGDPTRPASHGTKAVVLNPNDQVADAVLSQTFTTTPGQRYSLAFDLGTVERIADQRIRVRVRGSATLLEQLLVVAGANAGPFYIPHQLAFVADSSSATLTFIDESFSYVAIDALLDNVRVTAESAQAPLITSPPQRAAAVQGGNATFGVGVSGTGPFSYQWQFNGVGIAGANNSTYTVVGASDASAGNYRVVVSNAQQSVTSSAATLTVLPTAILLNGSFEFGSAAWTFSNTSVATSTNTAHGVTDGTQLAHFNWGQQAPNGTLSQTFATTPGQPYVLAFDVGAESLVNQDQQRMQITVQGISTRLSQSTTVTAPGNGTRYEPRSYAFTADSSMTTLTFQDTSLTTINVDLVLDNVRVTPQ